LGFVILLAEYDEPSLAAKKKRQSGALTKPTFTPKNRVWGFESTPSGRPCVDPQLSWENATGSVQFTYETASGRAGWLSKDPLKNAERLQGPNLYEYVMNNPIFNYDSSGTCTCEEAAEAKSAILAEAARWQAEDNPGYSFSNYGNDCGNQTKNLLADLEGVSQNCWSFQNDYGEKAWGYWPLDSRQPAPMILFF
jgi:hypothetical protein